MNVCNLYIDKVMYPEFEKDATKRDLACYGMGCVELVI